MGPRVREDDGIFSRTPVDENRDLCLGAERGPDFRRDDDPLKLLAQPLQPTFPSDNILIVPLNLSRLLQPAMQMGFLDL